MTSGMETILYPVNDSTGHQCRSNPRWFCRPPATSALAAFTSSRATQEGRSSGAIRRSRCVRHEQVHGSAAEAPW
jgi:hypothetical protein